MLPRDPRERRRLFEKFRREITTKELLRLLNRDDKVPGGPVDLERVLEALAIIRHFVGATDIRPMHFGLVIPARDEKLAELLSRLNVLLCRYRSAPIVWSIGPDGVWHRGRTRPYVRGLEEDAISKLIDLVESGKIIRLRQCEYKPCSRFFYAKQPDQLCCEKVCGQKLRATDDKLKKARNELLRKNRHSEAQRAAAQRNARPWPTEWTKPGRTREPTKG